MLPNKVLQPMSACIVLQSLVAWFEPGCLSESHGRGRS